MTMNSVSALISALMSASEVEYLVHLQYLVLCDPVQHLITGAQDV